MWCKQIFVFYGENFDVSVEKSVFQYIIKTHMKIMFIQTDYDSLS